MSTTTVARDAFDHFHSADYGKCDKLLDQISGFKSAADVKVVHNKLVTEYYKSGCADPQHLLTQLTQAYDKARERDKKDKSRKKKDEDEEDAYREDEDLAVLRYNQALLCLQLRQHAQATLILEELFENIEPIDDFLAIKCCFLLLELCLLQRDLEQAVAVLAYLEKPQAFLTVLRGQVLTAKADADADGGKEAGASKDGGAVAAVGAEAGGKGGAKAVEGEVVEGPLPSLTVGAFLPKHGRAPDVISRAEYRFFCNMYRARVDMALKSVKSAKKDAKNAMDVLEQELRQSPLLTPHPHTTGKAKADVGVALQEGLQRQHHAIVNMFKAYLEYTRQNVRKAMRLLTLCQFNFAERAGGAPVPEPSSKSKRRGNVEEDDEAIPVDFHPAQDDVCSPLFFNNLGCIHFLMHKPSLAAYYFQKSLHTMRPTAAPMSPAGLRLPGVLATRHWLDRRAEVAYNAGVQMLLSDRPAAALRCFEQCAPVFRTWPRLWMRMAECCIEVHRQSLVPPADAGLAAPSGTPAAGWSRVGGRPAVSGLRHLVWGVQGGAAHRRWLLSTTRDLPIGQRRGADEEESLAGKATPEADAEAAERALSQAELFLRNVLLIVGPILPADRGAGAGVEADAAAAASASASPAAASSGARASKAGGAVAASAAGASPKAAAASPSSATSTRVQARDLLESEYNLLEDSALVKLAYVSLCQRDFSGSLRNSRRLLEKNGVLSDRSGKASEEVDDSRKGWHFQAAAASAGNRLVVPSSVACVTMAVLYSAEALLMLERPQQARTLLASFIRGSSASQGVEAMSALNLDQHVVGPGPRRAADEPAASDVARRCCGGLDPDSSMGGLTPPAYILQCLGSSGKDRGANDEKEKNSKDSSQATIVMYPPCEFSRLGEAQCMLYTNLAAVHVEDGNLDEAEAACEKALQAQPRALAPLRTLVYVSLRKGDNPQALQRLKQWRG